MMMEGDVAGCSLITNHQAPEKRDSKELLPAKNRLLTGPELGLRKVRWPAESAFLLH
jgi:hypothetical protein